MKRLASYVSERGLKALIIVKVAVILGVLAADHGWLYWGDKSSVAAEAGASAPATTEASASADKQPATEAPEEATGKRRSYLEDLLDLPKIGTDELKKDEIGRYMALIERKKRQIDDRIKVLEQREGQLRGIEASIEKKLTKLEEEIKFFAATQQKEKEVKDERLAQLIEFYQKMQPKKAAPVFEKMDRDLVVALFKKMPQKQTTQILSLMKPERSVELSEYFGRIRSITEYDMLKEINSSLVKEFSECKNLPEPAH